MSVLPHILSLGWKLVSILSQKVSGIPRPLFYFCILFFISLLQRTKTYIMHYLREYCTNLLIWILGSLCHLLVNIKSLMCILETFRAPTYRVFGNEGYTESGSKLINFLPNLAPNEFLAFTINIRFHL